MGWSFQSQDVDGEHSFIFLLSGGVHSVSASGMLFLYAQSCADVPTKRLSLPRLG